MSLRQSLERSEGMQRHAVERLRERYGEALDDADLEVIRDYLANPLGRKEHPVRILVERKQTCNRVYYHLLYAGAEYKLIYARKDQMIRTFLPLTSTGKAARGVRMLKKGRRP